MYKFDRYHQYSLSDFNQPLGMEMNPENRWVKKAAMIPWDEIEDRYADLFPSEVGMPAKPLQTALGSLLIQKEYSYSDRELVEQIKENPYYQYFIGLPGYEYKAPFVPSLLVEFRKRLDEDVLAEINEMIAVYNNPDDSSDDDSNDGGNSADNTSNENDTNASSEPENEGTLILDATCAPQNIAFPQDINLLNEARENLESMIDQICADYHFQKPRMYREKAREAYLALAKCRKRTGKRIRKAIGQQLRFISRDLGYIDMFVLYNDVVLTEKQKNRLDVIKELYEQQKYMYDNKTHKVKDRIVSISQPYIRPIVRGKANAPVEFGAKLDMSIDEKGIARLEKLFDSSAYLFEEPENLLKQELREPATYNSIISAIAGGSSKLNEIATKSGIETGVCAKYIKVLLDLGIVKKETPLTEKSTKKTIYQIGDNFFRFWYRFVPMNMNAIISGRIEKTYPNTVRKYFSDYMGLIFEQMCKDYFLYYADELPFTLSDIGQWWGTDNAAKKEVQIDIVGTSSDNCEYIIGSCKYNNEKIGVDELELLRHYASVFGKGSRYHYYIFSKGGFTDSLRELGNKSEVTLLTLEDIYRQPKK